MVLNTVHSAPDRPRFYEVTENLMLPPHERYVCRVPVPVREEHIADFRKGRYFAYFFGHIWFLNAEGEEVSQSFSEMGQIGPKTFKRYVPAGAVPNEGGSEEVEGQNPN